MANPALTSFALSMGQDADSLSSIAGQMLGFPTASPPASQVPFSPASTAPSPVPPAAPTGWPALQGRIKSGESGNDYDALYGFANRPGGAFSGTKLTDMSVDDWIKFSDPSGPYAQHVKGQIGRVATPMGAYQVVGSTLRDAKKAMGLSGNEKMTKALQDEIGHWVYNTQGPTAWASLGNATQSTRDFPNSRETIDNSPLLQNTDPAESPEAAKRRRISDAISAFSVGLGQMSHGQSVDLSDVIKDHLDRQKDIRDRLKEINEEKQRTDSNKALLTSIADTHPELLGLAASGAAGMKMAQDQIEAERTQQMQQENIGYEQGLIGQREEAAGERTSADLQTRLAAETASQGRQFEHEGAQLLTNLKAEQERQQALFGHEDANLTTRIDAEQKRQQDLFGHEDKSQLSQQDFTAQQDAIKNTLQTTLQTAGFNHDDAVQQASQIFQKAQQDGVFQHDNTTLSIKQSFEKSMQDAGIAADVAKQAADQAFTTVRDQLGWKHEDYTNVFKSMTDKQAADALFQHQMDLQKAKATGKPVTANPAEVAAMYRRDGNEEAATLAENGRFAEASATANAMRTVQNQGTPGQQAAVATAGHELDKEGEQVISSENAARFADQLSNILSDPKFDTGMIDAKTMIPRAFLESIGLADSNTLTKDQLFTAIASRLSTNLRVPGTGNFSDADQAIAILSAPNMAKTPEANALIAKGIKEGARRLRIEHDAKVDWLDQHGASTKGKAAFIQSQMEANNATGDAYVHINGSKMSADEYKQTISALPAGEPYFETMDDGSVQIHVKGR